MNQHAVSFHVKFYIYMEFEQAFVAAAMAAVVAVLYAVIVLVEMVRDVRLTCAWMMERLWYGWLLWYMFEPAVLASQVRHATLMGFPVFPE